MTKDSMRADRYKEVYQKRIELPGMFIGALTNMNDQRFFA